MRMGLPQVILSDNGTEFDNRINSEMFRILGVKRRFTTPYHPQVYTVRIIYIIIIINFKINYTIDGLLLNNICRQTV